MNILIMTGSFGSGHSSVSNALAEELININNKLNINIVDYVKYYFNRESNHIYGFFEILVIKRPGLFNFGYRFSKDDDGDWNLPYKYMKMTDQLIKSKDIDLIICTVPLVSKIISSYKKRANSNIKLINLITDTGVHGGWISSQVDLYLVNNRSMEMNLIERKIDKNKIVKAAIPVRNRFKNKPRRDKNIIKEILVMGGGLGLIPDLDMIIGVLKNRFDVRVKIVTGNKNKSYQEENSLYKNIEFIGYTENIDEYMDRADFIITKPGGATLFEAIEMEKPILSFNPFLEQEKDNARFIEEYGFGKVIWEEGSLKYYINSFLNNELMMLRMKNNMMNYKEEMRIKSINNLIIGNYGNNSAS